MFEFVKSERKKNAWKGSEANGLSAEMGGPVISFNLDRPFSELSNATVWMRLHLASYGYIVRP